MAVATRAKVNGADQTTVAELVSTESMNVTKLRLNLVGTKPLLVHNARMANPLDPYRKTLAGILNNKKLCKTDEGILAIIRIESLGAIYETEDGLAGMPMDNVYSAIKEAARAFKRGADIERGLFYAPVVVPLVIGGRTWKVEEYLGQPDHIDYRPVGVNYRKTMRARPIFAQWSLVAEFELASGIMDVRDFLPIVQRAGSFVGLCERRPRYGTFRATVDVVTA